MYNPCFECMNKYGKQYSKECDNICDFAIAIKLINELQDKIDELEMALEYQNDW